MPKLFFIILSVFITTPILAWDNHATMTQAAIDQSSNLNAYLNQQIPTESLADFLKTTTHSLPQKLNQIEQELRRAEAGYRPLPENLTYAPAHSDCAQDLVICFKKSLRINLNASLDAARNENISLRDALITASSQPDFGFDLYLYEDSGTAFGKYYGFKTQPLGISTTEFGTQILFHMSTYQDDPQILNFIPRLNEDYPEYRAIQYFELSRFAANAHHPYWSAVFLGWGLHYIQDMTQPYHAILSNGASSDDLAIIISQAKQGNPLPLQAFIALQTDRHILLEGLTDYILSATNDSLYRPILISALKNTALDHGLHSCEVRPGYIRQHVDLRMAKTSAEYQAMLLATMPASFVSDPSFNAGEFNAYDDLFYTDMNEAQRVQFTEQVVKAMQWFGAYTRNCLKQYKVYSPKVKV